MRNGVSGMKLFAYLVLIFAALRLSGAEGTVTTGYHHQGSDVVVTVEFIARHYESSEKEVLRIPVRIVKDRRIAYSWELVPSAEYERKRKEYGDRKFYLPHPRLAGATMVNRGDPPKSVAWSGRAFIWPLGFQLQDGDVIRIFEVIG